MLLGTRMTNNEPSAITDLDVVARYDATDPKYVVKDNSNRISALLDKSKRLVVGEELFTDGYNLVDSNSDGLADGFAIFNNIPTIKSIIAGNGFPGKAQRVESTNTTIWGLSIGNVTNRKVYKLSFYYRSNKQFVAGDGHYSYATLPANNGMAIQKEIIFASNQSGLRPVYFGFFNELDAYIEVGNITIKEIIGNHIVQLEIPKKPIHTYDNDTKEWFALFDGVDDYLKSLPFTLNQPTGIYSCLKQNSWTDGNTIYDGYTVNTARLRQYELIGRLRQYTGIGFNNTTKKTIGTFDNIYSLFNGAMSANKLNNLSKIVSADGVVSISGFTLAAIGSGSGNSHISVKEIIIKRIATDESDTIFNYFKNKHNVQY